MSWGTMPEWNDANKVMNVVEPHLFGCSVVEVLYGAADAEGNSIVPSKDADDGHKTYLALELDGQYEEIPSIEAVTECVEKKRELEKKAYELSHTRDASGKAQYAELLAEWTALPDYDTPREREFLSKIQASEERYNQKLAGYEHNKEEKKKLIEQAQALSTSTEWKQTSAKMRELFDSWKMLGFAGEDCNDELWDEFRSARQKFYDAQDAYFKDKDEKRAAAKETKQQLIAEAKELTENVQNWKQTGEKMAALMERWKEAGSTGHHDEDDKLWEEFNSYRITFFTGRKEFLKSQEAKYQAAAQKKKELIAKAKEISDQHSTTAENTEIMKDLSKQWKEAGFAGRDQDDKLWKEFCDAKDVFWNEKRAKSDEKHSEWLAKREDYIGRRKDRIANLQSQNRKLHERAENSSNIGLITKLNGYIDENNEQIRKLQDEIRDLESKN